MASTSATRAQGGGPLARWVFGPLVGLALLAILGSQLDSRGCGEGGLGSSTAGAAFEVIGLGGAALLVGLGIWRLVRLVRGRGGRRWADRRIVAVVALVLAAFVAYAVRNNGVATAAFVGVFFFGMLVSLFSFVALSVALLQKQGTDEVGILLPAYLLGVGLTVYLPVVAIAAAIVGGCWGE